MPGSDDHRKGSTTNLQTVEEIYGQYVSAKLDRLSCMLPTEFSTTVPFTLTAAMFR